MIDERNEFLDYVSNIAYSVPILFGVVDGANPFRAKKSSQARGLATMFNIYNALSSTRKICTEAKIVSREQLHKELGLVNNKVERIGCDFVLMHENLATKYLEVLNLFNERASDTRIESKLAGLKTLIRINLESVKLEDLFRLAEIVTDSLVNIAVTKDRMLISQFFNGHRHSRLWISGQLWQDIALSSGLRPDNRQQILRNNERLLNAYAIHLERGSVRL